RGGDQVPVGVVRAPAPPPERRARADAAAGAALAGGRVGALRRGGAELRGGVVAGAVQADVRGPVPGLVEVGGVVVVRVPGLVRVHEVRVVDGLVGVPDAGREDGARPVQQPVPVVVRLVDADDRRAARPVRVAVDVHGLRRDAGARRRRQRRQRGRHDHPTFHVGSPRRVNPAPLKRTRRRIFPGPQVGQRSHPPQAALLAAGRKLRKGLISRGFEGKSARPRSWGVILAEPAANLPPPASPSPPPNLQVVPPPPKQGWSLEAVAAIVGLLAVLVLLAFMLVPVAKGMQPVLAEGANVAKPSDLVFLLFATAAVVSAGGVAFSRNIIYSALSLLGTLLSTGALYIFL